jgi:hypothetical protein
MRVEVLSRKFLSIDKYVYTYVMDKSLLFDFFMR